MTAALWGWLLGLPLLAAGLVALVRPAFASAAVERFQASRVAAAVLTVAAWFWTAYECDTIGIDVFDMLLKRFPGQVWLMAAVLAYLTCLWMAPHLSVRALTGILMLIPAELFKVTRPLLGDGSPQAVHVLVVSAYVGAVIGMYGMFYPWRLERWLGWVRSRPALFRGLGLLLAGWGLALVVAGGRA